jgi:hypothetical protein
MLCRAALTLASAGARRAGADAASASASSSTRISRAFLTGVATKAPSAAESPPGVARVTAAAAAAAGDKGAGAAGGASPQPLTTVTPEQRLTVLARFYARTRDAPELLVMYVGVGTALSLLAYTFSEMVFDTRRGEHLGILLDTNVRGDFERQLASSQRAADASSRALGAPAGSSGPAGGRRSLWYVLGHVMVDDEGANVSVPPFNNRVRPFQYSKPAGAGVSATGGPPA